MMPEFKIADALQRIRRAASDEPAGAGPRAPEPQAVKVSEPSRSSVGQGDLFSGQTSSPPTTLSQRAPMPTAHLPTLAVWQRVFPRDASRWETLLHNAWMTDPSWYGTLCLFCSGGCSLVVHKEAGWALRYDAETVDKLRRAGSDLAFASEAEYREYAGKALGPRKAEFTELLQLSSLGRLTDEDFSWAFNEAIRRKVG